MLEGMQKEKGLNKIRGSHRARITVMGEKGVQGEVEKPKQRVQGKG